MTKLTPQQLQTISEHNLGKERHVAFGLALMADLYQHMIDNPAEFNGNFSTLIRQACTFYLDNVGKSMTEVIRQTIREEMGKIKVIEAKERVVEGSNGKIDDSEGFFS